jgi:hypothetical protein
MVAIMNGGHLSSGPSDEREPPLSGGVLEMKMNAPHASVQNSIASQDGSQSPRHFLKGHTMDLNTHLNQEICYILNIWLFESPLNPLEAEQRGQSNIQNVMPITFYEVFVSRCCMRRTVPLSVRQDVLIQSFSSLPTEPYYITIRNLTGSMRLTPRNAAERLSTPLVTKSQSQIRAALRFASCHD